MKVQTYRIGKGSIQIWWSLGIVCTLLAAGLLLLSWVDVRGRFVTLPLTVFLGAFALRCFWRAMSAGSKAVQADDEGLWLSARSRDAGLVRWEDIQRAERHRYRAQLVLYGKDEQPLIRVSYYLQDFGKLEELIVDRVDKPEVALPTNYYSAEWSMVSLLILVVFILAVCPFALLMIILGLMLTKHGASFVWMRLDFNDQHLRLQGPLKVEYVARNEIASIAIGGIHESILPLDGVILRLNAGKPALCIKNFYYSDEDMERRIERWLEDGPKTEPALSQVVAGDQSDEQTHA